MTRKNLSDELADHLRDLIATGKLEEGERINEVHLATSLEVSRTPLREALGRLVSEGLVKSLPRKGFYVHKPDPEEVEQLYIMRAILDPAALRMAGPANAKKLDRLEALNLKILSAKGNAGLIIDYDDQWHLELLSHCTNYILLDLIQQFMRRTRSLEYAYMLEHANVEVAVGEHRRIQQALQDQDVERAASILHQNMQSAVPVLMNWVRARRKKASKIK